MSLDVSQQSFANSHILDAETRMDNPLRRSTATADTGAAFRAEREGGLALVTPLITMAEVWLKANCRSDATWLGSAPVVEMQYFPILADAIIEAGCNYPPLF